MSSSSLRLLFCAVVIAGLAGCGGSSKSGSSGSDGSGPTIVTFTFTGNVTPAVSTQIGTGAYTQATLTSGKLTLSIPNGETNFSVAYNCNFGDSNSSSDLETIIQVSVLDGTSFGGGCSNGSTSHTGLATVQVNAAAIPGA